MRAIFISIDRSPKPNYMADTEASFLSNGGGDFTVLVGNDSASYLQSSKGTVIPLQAEEASALAVYPLRFRGATNYARMISHELETAPEDLLACEDDIQFTCDFRRKLQKALTSVPVKRFILTLYSAHNLNGKPIDEINPRSFFGTQAIFFPWVIRRDLALYYKRRLAAWTKDIPVSFVTYDMVLADFCRENSIPIYACNPSLVQHTGLLSTGFTPDDRQHRSPSFKP
ncbi:MAG TPA: hypothetical protein VEH27_11860 [Methylomirabilota bacterium]|nr:hypothetical protein [Methylomirabilota bacterium]